MAMFSFTKFQKLTTLLAFENEKKSKGVPKEYQGGKGLRELFTPHSL